MFDQRAAFCRNFDQRLANGFNGRFNKKVALWLAWSIRIATDASRFFLNIPAPLLRLVCQLINTFWSSIISVVPIYSLRVNEVSTYHCNCWHATKLCYSVCLKTIRGGSTCFAFVMRLWGLGVVDHCGSAQESTFEMTMTRCQRQVLDDATTK